MEAIVIAQLRDVTLLAQIVLVEHLQAAHRSVTDRLRKLRRDETGQTPTEYLMIVGLMAVVIVTVFVVYYWQNVKTVARTWVGNVRQSVAGQSIR
jgi:Flp pilus assembly pilin Flp